MKTLIIFIIILISASLYAAPVGVAPKEPKSPQPMNIIEPDEPQIDQYDNIFDEPSFKEPPEPLELDIREVEPKFNEEEPPIYEPDIRMPNPDCPKGVDCK